MQQTLIDFYRAIEATSLQMLEAAKAENWDDVVRLEGACAVLIEQLRFRSRSEELEPQERADGSTGRCTAGRRLAPCAATGTIPQYARYSIQHML